MTGEQRCPARFELDEPSDQRTHTCMLAAGHDPTEGHLCPVCGGRWALKVTRLPDPSR